MSTFFNYYSTISEKLKDFKRSKPFQPQKPGLFAFSSFSSAFIHQKFLKKMSAPFCRCQNPKPWQALSCILKGWIHGINIYLIKVNFTIPVSS